MKPQHGDTVRVHYTGTLSDGSQFDSSEGRDPLTFTLGEQSVIPGFETTVEGLDVGESAHVTILAEDAYGVRMDDALQRAPRSMFGEMVPEVGIVVALESPTGEQVAATIVEVDEDVVTLDFNHPLSGQDLTFDITLVEIVGE